MSENTITNPVGVPNEFVNVDQWICWREEERDGKPTKIPVTPRTGAFASSTDPETWTDFETALEYVRSDEADGLGFVFTDDDPFVGIDLDDCRDPETVSVDDDTRQIVNHLNSYTEVSPSGTGFHVLIKGELPEGRNLKGSVEMYDSARFFTMTGDRVDVKPQTVEERQDALAEVHREYVQEPSMAGETASAETNGTSATPAADVDLTDEELIEKAQNAANSEKFERLWRGDISSYESQSEADMAFCCLLAFWTGGDEKRMDELFRQSGLIRPKWDEQHFADGATYGERTIERAIRNTSEFYEPSGDGESDHVDTTDQPEQASTIKTAMTHLRRHRLTTTDRAAASVPISRNRTRFSRRNSKNERIPLNNSGSESRHSKQSWQCFGRRLDPKGATVNIHRLTNPRRARKRMSRQCGDRVKRLVEK